MRDASGISHHSHLLPAANDPDGDGQFIGRLLILVFFLVAIVKFALSLN